VVDDDIGMVETLTDILDMHGYRVTPACSGEAALERVREAPHALALMDIQMPGLNGVETLEALRPIAPTMPVIFMTAYARHELTTRARETAVAVLPKPLDIPAALTLIDAAIHQAGADSAGTGAA
jgi:two-component system response regulator FlrC